MSTILIRMARSFVILAGVVVSGCTTTETSSPKAEGAPNGVSNHSSDGTGNFGQLSPEEQKFAEALAHYSQGLIHVWHNESSEALQEWKEVVRLDPSRTELRDRIAQEYLRKKDFKKMAEVLEIETRQDPKSVTSWSLLAVAYRSDKQFDKAIEAAEKAIKLDHTNFSPYHVLFEVAIEQESPEKARKVLDRAARQKSDHSIYWLRLADLYVALGAREPRFEIQKEEIIRFYERAIALRPDDPDLVAHVADYCVRAQNTAKAIQLYLKILEARPNATNIREKLALSYVVDGKKDLAIKALKEIVEREPLRYQIYSLIGELCEDLKNYDEALANYRLSLSVNANQLPPYLRIVLLELRNKRPEEALTQLKIAGEKFPNNFQVRFFYGLTYSDSRDYARAVECFEQALKLGQASNPEALDGAFHFYYGSALERNGQFDQAVVQFQKALELNPDYADAYNYLGFMYADKNVKLDEASRLIEKALAYEPENGAFLDSMGWVYFRQGKLDQALIYLQRAIKIIRNDAVVFDHLGDVYLRMGNAPQALAQYEKAAELDPKNKEIKEKLENARRAASPSTQPASNPAPASSPTPQ